MGPGPFVHLCRSMGPLTVFDFNMLPKQMLEAQEVQTLGLVPRVPDINSTLRNVSGRVIDFALITASLAHAVEVKPQIEVPWLHHALEIHILRAPRSFHSVKLRQPDSLPIEQALKALSAKKRLRSIPIIQTGETKG